MRPVVAATDLGVQLVVVPQWLGKFALPRSDAAAICILGDDDDAAFGPTAFDLRSLQKVFGKAHAIALITCGLIPEIYRDAALIALHGGRVVIVESRMEYEPQWYSIVEPHRGHAAILNAACETKGNA